jgi:hypothetical protein
MLARHVVLGAGSILVASACSSSDPRREDAVTSGDTGDSICKEAATAWLDGYPAYPWCRDHDVWTDDGINTRETGGNGWVQTEGGYGYQCTEWAVRYFYFKWQVPRPWYVGVAKDMCGGLPAGVTTTRNPVHGDLAVFVAGCGKADPKNGHVGAIDTVDASTISIIQQNPAGRVQWSKSCVACYLHADANTNTSVVAVTSSSCHSATLDAEVPHDTCVQAASDGRWYTCVDGDWQSGQMGCTSSYAWCDSATLGRPVPSRTCVRSSANERWYQCDDQSWDPLEDVAHGGPLGPCSATYAGP